MTPENKIDTPETLYLKEALRLSEEQLKQQNKTLAIIERKATLLVTLQIATIAYLISYISDKDVEKTMPLIYLCFILVIAALVGAFASYTHSVGVPGANPKYLMHEYFNCDFNKMARNLLTHYNKGIELNNKISKKKGLLLIISFWFGLGVIVCAFLWIIKDYF